MARLEVLTPEQIADPDLARMAAASRDEMYGVYGHCPDRVRAVRDRPRALGEGAGAVR